MDGGIAGVLGSVFGAIYLPGKAIWRGEPVTDAGGSIVTPGAVIMADCRVQVDQATEVMRQAEGYTDRDMRIIVLASGLTRDVDSDTTIRVLLGANAGDWLVSRVSRDPAGAYFDCTGRRA